MESRADLLLAGPRGRRLLVEYAIASELLVDAACREASFSAGLQSAERQLDPGRERSSAYVGDVAHPSFAPAAITPDAVTPETVADRLASVALAEVTPAMLRDCLFISTDMARYWQRPDGTDILAGLDVMREPLRRVAEHVAASPHTAWWGARVDVNAQWVIGWDDESSAVSEPDPASVLGEARDRLLDDELVARRERPVDPTANWSGEWWSRPSWGLHSSAGELFDGSPTKLWFVEDSLGWERAGARRLSVPSGLRVYEIDGAEAWRRLCATFPLDVTAQKRHDWYRTTGRSGAWVIPDWAGVAEHYDAVHLQVDAYLSAAGTVIPVGEGTASVIAGWDPDETFWFAAGVREFGASVGWSFSADADSVAWTRDDGREDAGEADGPRWCSGEAR